MTPTMNLKPDFVALARRWAMDAEFDVVLFAFEECDGATGRILSSSGFDHSELGRDPRSYAIRRANQSVLRTVQTRSFPVCWWIRRDPRSLYNEDVAMHIRLAFAGSLSPPIRSLDYQSSSWRLHVVCQIDCDASQAQFHVMRRTAMRDGGNRYAAEISRRLWQIAECLAAELDWQTADKAVLLATELSGLDALPEGSVFKMLNLISPRVAIRVENGSSGPPSRS